jgi:hypothetical protein
VTSNGGLILVRELDERLGFSELIDEHLAATTARSNSCRENNCNIWLKMLDTRIMAAVVLLWFTPSQRKP